MIKICKYCGKEFEPKKSNQIYCTDMCRWGAYSKKSYEKIRHSQKENAVAGKTLKEWSLSEGEYGQQLLNEYSSLNLIPSDKVPAGSGKRFYWKCSKCGYEWLSIMRNRTRDRRGCPSCAGLVIENNNLYKWCLENGERGLRILDEYSIKNKYSTKEIAPKSGEKVYWKCSKCHYEWQATVGSRTNIGSDCPRCNKYSTSLGEQIIFYILCMELREYTVYNRKKISNYEIDILIPELKLGIEYSGYIFHQNRQEYDREKMGALTNFGYSLITIVELSPKDIVNNNMVYNFSFIRSGKLDPVPMLDFLKNYLSTQYNIDIDITLTDKEIDYCRAKSTTHTEYTGDIDIDTIFVLKAIGKKYNEIPKLMNCSPSGIWSRLHIEDKDEINKRENDIYNIVRALSIGMCPDEISSLNNDETGIELEFEQEEENYDLDFVLKIKSLLEKYKAI